MTIKKGDQIEVFFTATAMEDMDGLELMEFLLDEVPRVRVFNPGYRHVKRRTHNSTPWRDEVIEIIKKEPVIYPSDVYYGNLIDRDDLLASLEKGKL